MVLGAMLFYCIAPIHASGDQQNAEPNDLRWDLAENLEVRWTAVELSAKVASGVTPYSLTRELIISAEFRIRDAEGLVTVEPERPRIVKVSDGRGNAVPWRFEQGSAARWYEDGFWPWHSGQVGPWYPFTLTLRLPDDPNIPTPSSLGAIEAYVYGLCGDVVSLDIPFDPNSGWHKPKAVPDLQICVDPVTPPCPGPLRYVPVSLLSGSSKGLGSFPYRPTTPVSLSRYTT